MKTVRRIMGSADFDRPVGTGGGELCVDMSGPIPLATDRLPPSGGFLDYWIVGWSRAPECLRLSPAGIQPKREAPSFSRIRTRWCFARSNEFPLRTAGGTLTRLLFSYCLCFI